MQITTSYIQDEALFRTRGQIVWAVLLGAVLVLFPIFGPGHWVYFCGLLAINIIATTGLNIITGYTGLLSLGHAAFMGVGAYTAALLAVHFNMPFYLTLPAAGALTALVGVAFGLPSLRIRGLYLVIATLAAQFILHFVFVEWDSLTKGDVGLVLEPARIFGITLNTERHMFFLVTPVAIVMLLFAHNLFRSRVGRAFVAIRERDLTAEVLGVHLVKYKLMSFAIGSFYAGVAGGLMAYFFRFVIPEQYGLLLSVFFLASVIVGGMGSTLGSILGALFMTILPEVLRLIVQLFGDTYGVDVTKVLVPLRETVFGLLIVLFLIFAPHGLVQIWERIRLAVATWPLKG
ncbi:MAG: branched-chain amino acid ABC transporter permease [Candidatus Lambdaproteobacteria bacterium]|nr:branched-chain amino acid ABC transporter permease [Candidatus Lambdaproteobacteria bacterium]